MRPYRMQFCTSASASKNLLAPVGEWQIVAKDDDDAIEVARRTETPWSSLSAFVVVTNEHGKVCGMWSSDAAPPT